MDDDLPVEDVQEDPEAGWMCFSLGLTQLRYLKHYRHRFFEQEIHLNMADFLQLILVYWRVSSTG